MDRSLFVSTAAWVLIVAASSAWFFVTQMAIGKRVRGPFPVSSLVILLVTSGLTALQFVNEGVLRSLERHSGDLADGRFWKLFTPLFVQGDGWSGVIFNTIAFLIVAPVAERVYGRRRILLMYFIPGVIGQAAGFLWTDHGAGNSVAIAGLIGGFFVLEIVHTHRLPKVAPIVAICGLAAAVVLTGLAEMHGPPVLAGAVLGYVLNYASPMLPHHLDPQADTVSRSTA
ncbi:MAG TPA: rhomboid family intramembrane serine protease [Thermomicrobiales bacterium]|nr:rhomboid family intramembrane serine protease [Thermomicrobiales bacterium]